MFWNSQVGLLRPLLGLNWFNWSWTGLTNKLRTWTMGFGSGQESWDLGQSLSSLIGPPVVLPLLLLLCLRINHRTGGFMGKQRA